MEIDKAELGAAAMALEVVELETSDCFRNLVAVDEIVRFLRGEMMLASQLFRTPSDSFIDDARLLATAVADFDPLEAVQAAGRVL